MQQGEPPLAQKIPGISGRSATHSALSVQLLHPVLRLTFDAQWVSFVADTTQTQLLSDRHGVMNPSAQLSAPVGHVDDVTMHWP
jgi:hypothetical protein